MRPVIFLASAALIVALAGCQPGGGGAAAVNDARIVAADREAGN